MKRVLSIVLALALILCLTACGGENASVQPSQTETTAPTAPPRMAPEDRLEEAVKQLEGLKSYQLQDTSDVSIGVAGSTAPTITTVKTSQTAVDLDKETAAYATVVEMSGTEAMYWYDGSIIYASDPTGDYRAPGTVEEYLKTAGGPTDLHDFESCSFASETDDNVLKLEGLKQEKLEEVLGELFDQLTQLGMKDPAVEASGTLTLKDSALPETLETKIQISFTVGETTMAVTVSGKTEYLSTDSGEIVNLPGKTNDFVEVSDAKIPAYLTAADTALTGAASGVLARAQSFSLEKDSGDLTYREEMKMQYDLTAGPLLHLDVAIDSMGQSIAQVETFDGTSYKVVQNGQEYPQEYTAEDVVSMITNYPADFTGILSSCTNAELKEDAESLVITMVPDVEVVTAFNNYYIGLLDEELQDVLYQHTDYDIGACTVTAAVNAATGLYTSLTASFSASYVVNGETWNIAYRYTLMPEAPEV